MRPGEALGLKWADIDLESCVVRVQRALATGPNGPELREPKTLKSRRAIPFPADTASTLRRHRTNQLSMRLEQGEGYDAEADLVFATYRGTPLDYSNLVRQHFKPIVASAGLAPLRLYDLRHTCATLMLGLGIHAKIVAERLGHASTAMTLDVYSHVSPTLQEAATQKLGSALFRS